MTKLQSMILAHLRRAQGATGGWTPLADLPGDATTRWQALIGLRKLMTDLDSAWRIVERHPDPTRTGYKEVRLVPRFSHLVASA